MISTSNGEIFHWEVDLGGMDMVHLVEIDEWCRRTFGMQGIRWIATNMTWQLRTYEDAFMLEMAWG